MTHDELLARIDDIEQRTNHTSLALGVQTALLTQNSALRAVVELHKPIETYNMNNVYKAWLTCNHCNDEMYPCPTIQAIEKEFG